MNIQTEGQIQDRGLGAFQTPSNATAIDPRSAVPQFTSVDTVPVS